MTRLDLRDALRGLRRDRLYSLVTVATFALTIGATTAVFSIVNGVLLKPLAYDQPERLVAIREIWRQFSDKYPTLPVNEQHFEYWRKHATSFESAAQYIRQPANLTGAGEATRVTVVHTSSALFDVLRVAPALGRSLLPEDEIVGRPEAVVVTDLFWRQRLGGDRAAIGRPIALDGSTYTVVGVLPAGFLLPVEDQLTAKMDMFVPIRVDEDHVEWAGDHNTAVIARLKPGRTIEQARAELGLLQAQVSEIATKEAHEPVTLSADVRPLADSIVGTARRGLLLLLAAIAAVLLIACSNLANLSLTRTLGGLRDVAIRAALGAARARIVSRILVEQFMLASAGGVLGLGIAWGALVLFVRTAPIDLPRVGDVSLDARVLAFAAMVTIVAGTVVGLLPAWYAGRRDVQTALRTGGGTFTSDRRGARARATLVTVQVALSVALVAMTALLTLSFVRLLRIDRGFDAEKVVALPLTLPGNRYEAPAARVAAYDRVLEEVRRLPGVRRAASTSMLPLTGQSQVNFIVADGDTRPMSEQPTANFRVVAPDFFSAMGMRMIAGRAFRDDERATDRPAPVVISQSAAARLWPGQDPIGRRFSRGQPGEQGFQVVGVVADARTTSLDRVPPLMVYPPYWWASPASQRTSTSLLIKTASDPAMVVSTARQAIHRIDPEIAIGDVRTLDAMVDASLAGRRYQLRLFVAFGAIALLIAALGVYAVTAYSVSRRRREMNIRAALGASARQVRGLVVRQAVAPVVAGVALGVAVSLGAGVVVSSLLFEVSARDPRVIAAVAVLVGVVGAGATMVAARQGLSLNPASALRDE